ncbi:MAG: hotdog fold thioesterase, partial [Candidatus Lokiarchaeota archaeon]|nr:hotdog fold thioesterase [Candidatus Lokiarchaeota archaeon]MBD3339208.1 hotdog fold thioesterase [Candidatus Lokiarchaeota archaeon]
SQRMIKLFNDLKGKEMKNFPAPPFSKFLNGRIMHAERGKVEIEFELRPEFANPTGLLHGGMQCALMDDTIGVMTTTLGYQGFLITIDFHVDYLSKVKVDEKVKVMAKMVREGRNIVHAVAEIYDLNGKLIATSNSNLLKTGFTPDFVKNVDKLEDSD